MRRAIALGAVALMGCSDPLVIELDERPSVTITQPAPNDTVNGAFQLAASYWPSIAQPSSVTLYVVPDPRKPGIVRLREEPNASTRKGDTITYYYSLDARTFSPPGGFLGELGTNVFPVELVVEAHRDKMSFADTALVYMRR